MFDIVRCHYRLPDPEYQDEDFQTKQFGQSLARFTITTEGRLLREERTFGLLSEEPLKGGKTRSNETRISRIQKHRRTKLGGSVDLNFHGDVRIYLTNDERQFVEYAVRFTHGTVESIHRINAVEDPAESQTLATLADVVETAEWAHTNTLRACFEELSAIDPDLANAAVETLGDRVKAAIWFGTSRVPLAGHSPYQAAAAGKREDVLKVLHAIERGFLC